MKCRHRCSILFVLMAVPFGIMAQPVEDKSQIRLAYEAKTAFVGEVVYVVEPPEGPYTTPSFAQTMVLRIDGRIKGHTKSFNSYVGLSIAVTKDLRLFINKGDRLIVLLNNQSFRITDNCDFAGVPQHALRVGNVEKIPCYWIENSKSILPGSEEELNAIKALFR